MTDGVNPSQPPQTHNPVDDHHHASQSAFPGGGHTFKAGGPGFSSFKNWLGPKGYKQFQQTLCQQISTEIKRQKEEAKKASDQLKRSAKGEDLYD